MLNNKKFLQIQLTDFQTKLFTIYYLDETNQKIHHTSPSSNIILYNLTNSPTEWIFQQAPFIPNKIDNSKILPKSEDILKLSIFNFTKKSPKKLKTQFNPKLKLPQESSQQDTPNKKLKMLIFIPPNYPPSSFMSPIY